uniref:CX domain-containing protein n=2 Tax=Caenorhabditis tropicalis TaxID=1561998 RepID=A0A1I7V1Y9_9PELO
MISLSIISTMMKNLLVFLAMSSVIFGENTDAPYKLIKNISDPVLIGKTELFWTYQLVIGKPVHCVVHINADEWEHGEYIFINGTKPNILHYSCPFGSRCARFQCLSEDVTIPVLGFVAFVVGICVCCAKSGSRSQRQRRREYVQHDSEGEGYELMDQNRVRLVVELPIDETTEMEDVFDDPPSAGEVQEEIV